MDKDPKVTRCALQNYCVCSKTGDCSDFPICTAVDGYNVYNKDTISGILSSILSYNPKNITSINEAVKIASINILPIY